MGSLRRVQIVAAVLVAVGAGAVTFYVTQPRTSGAPPGADRLSASEIRTILDPDAIRAVDNPHFVTAEKAGARGNLFVIGVEIGGEAHAYPIAFMSRVEIVNDRIGGANIAVTW